MKKRRIAESEFIVGQRQLAVALGRSISTANAWLHHPDWPFERVGPWNPDDVPAMTEWAGGHLRQHDAKTDPASDGFWNRWTPRDALPPTTEDAAGILPLLPEKLPALLVTTFELHVLAGKRKVTPAEAIRIVDNYVTFRTMLAHYAAVLPSWFEAQSREEIARRMRAVLFHDFETIHQFFEELSND